MRLSSSFLCFAALLAVMFCAQSKAHSEGEKSPYSGLISQPSSNDSSYRSYSAPASGSQGGYSGLISAPAKQGYDSQAGRNNNNSRNPEQEAALKKKKDEELKAKPYNSTALDPNGADYEYISQMDDEAKKKMRRKETLQEIEKFYGN